MAAGQEVLLPNFGMETLHHVHAADVAQFILKAIMSRSASVGEAFNVVYDKALSLRGYAEAMYRWFGHEPNLRFLPFDDWKSTQSPDQAIHAFEHISRSHAFSIEKARSRVGYSPRYTSLEAIKEPVSAAIEAGEIRVERIRTS